MNNRAQLDYPIVTWVIIVFALLIIAPVMLKIFTSIKNPMSAGLGNVTGGAIAQANFNKVMGTAINFWDEVVIAAFVLATCLLFISAFMTNSHPFWLVLYIFISFMLVLFAPDIIGALDNIYNSSAFAAESASLSFIGGLRQYFGVILVGIIITTGIIIYSKIAIGGSRR